MFAVLVFSIGLAWFGHEIKQAREQREAAEALRKLGAWVFYDYQDLEGNSYPPPGQPPGPQWLRNMIGDDLFIEVVQIRSGPPGPGPSGFTPRLRMRDSDLVCLKACPNLEALDLERSQVTDAGMVHLRPLSKLKTLNLSETEVTDAGLLNLHELKHPR